MKFLKEMRLIYQSKGQMDLFSYAALLDNTDQNDYLAELEFLKNE